MYQHKSHRRCPLRIFVNKSAKFVCPSSLPTRRIPAATASTIRQEGLLNSRTASLIVTPLQINLELHRLRRAAHAQETKIMKLNRSIQLIMDFISSSLPRDSTERDRAKHGAPPRTQAQPASLRSNSHQPSSSNYPRPSSTPKNALFLTVCACRPSLHPNQSQARHIYMA